MLRIGLVTDETLFGGRQKEILWDGDGEGASNIECGIAAGAARGVHSSGEGEGGGVTLQIGCFIMQVPGPHPEQPSWREKNHFRRASLYRALAIIPLATQFARHILLMSGIPSKSVDFQPPQPQYLAVLWHETGLLTYSIGVCCPAAVDMAASQTLFPMPFERIQFPSNKLAAASQEVVVSTADLRLMERSGAQCAGPKSSLKTE